MRSFFLSGLFRPRSGLPFRAFRASRSLSEESDMISSSSPLSSISEDDSSSSSSSSRFLGATSLSSSPWHYIIIHPVNRARPEGWRNNVSGFLTSCASSSSSSSLRLARREEAAGFLAADCLLKQSSSAIQPHGLQLLLSVTGMTQGKVYLVVFLPLAALLSCACAKSSSFFFCSSSSLASCLLTRETKHSHVLHISPLTTIMGKV